MTVPFWPLLGIDIGSSAVKIAELSGSGSTRKLKAMGLELIPPEAMVDGVIQEDELVETAIAELLEKLKINPKGRRAAIAVRGPSVEIKRLLLEAGKGNLEEQIDYEIEQHFQMDVADMYYQYQELPNWSEDPSRVPVLVAGAASELVDQLVGIVRNVGLRIGVVDCAPICLANTFDFNYPPSNSLVGLIDVGSNASTLSLMCNGQLLHTCELHAGGDEVTRQIAQNLGLDHGNAEAMKLTVVHGAAIAPEPMQRVVDDSNELLVSEIQEALRVYFENSTPIPGVTGLEHVFLAGGGAKLTGLDTSLASALQVPVQLLNPFNQIDVNPRMFEVDYILNQGHAYSVAVGLGLRRFGDGVAAA